MPSVKPASWYADNGYTTGGTLEDDIEVFASSYSSSGSAKNIAIIAYADDISITGGGAK